MTTMAVTVMVQLPVEQLVVDQEIVIVVNMIGLTMVLNAVIQHGMNMV